MGLSCVPAASWPSQFMLPFNCPPFAYPGSMSPLQLQQLQLLGTASVATAVPAPPPPAAAPAPQPAAAACPSPAPAAAGGASGSEEEFPSPHKVALTASGNAPLRVPGNPLAVRGAHSAPRFVHPKPRRTGMSGLRGTQRSSGRRASVTQSTFVYSIHRTQNTVWGPVALVFSAVGSRRGGLAGAEKRHGRGRKRHGRGRKASPKLTGRTFVAPAAPTRHSVVLSAAVPEGPLVQWR
jgi:hypothetical protein